MVSLSTILPASALVLAALATTQVDAHGYVLIPESEFTSGGANSAWIVQIDPQFASDDWDGNNNQSVTTWKTLAAENSVTDLRTLLDSDTSLYGADCGFTNPDADAKTPPNDGTATFSRGMVHVGPCEIWLDDTKVLTNDNCEYAYGTGEQDVKSIFPVDYSSCSTSGCMLRFYWLAFQGLNSKTVWQVYKDCVPLTGPASSDGSSTTTTTATSSATSATTSASASTAASATEASASSAASATAESAYSSASTEASASTESSAASESTYSSASAEASASTESSTEASASTEADASYASASTEASASSGTETTTSSDESTASSTGSSAATSTESSAAETEAPASTTATPTATTAAPTASSSSSDKCNVRARK